MLILGDIGNSVTKLFLVNSKDKILKKISLPSKSITNSILNRKFKILTKDFKNIKKILFCSVVPKNFNSIKRVESLQDEYYLNLHDLHNNFFHQLNLLKIH